MPGRSEERADSKPQDGQGTRKHISINDRGKSHLDRGPPKISIEGSDWRWAGKGENYLAPALVWSPTRSAVKVSLIRMNFGRPSARFARRRAQPSGRIHEATIESLRAGPPLSPLGKRLEGRRSSPFPQTPRFGSRSLRPGQGE